MTKFNKIITVLAIVILASLGWYFFVQKTILNQNVSQDASRVDPGFRRIAAELTEPEPTPPPLLYLVRPDTSENYTDPSSSGDTFDVKLTSKLPAPKNGVPYRLAGGEIFAVRIIATPKSKGLINNFLHLEELRVPIRFDNRYIEPVTITDANGLVKLDETGLSEECSFYQLNEPQQTNLASIGSLGSFYYDKRFPRDVADERFARYRNVKDKGIQLQENACIGEIKFRVIQKSGAENLANPEALVKIPNLEREIGVDARGPAGSDPVDTSFPLGDIGINEHLNWKISNNQILGTFAIGYRLLSEQPTPTATPTLVPASYCAGVTQIPELECLALVAIFTNANGRLQNAQGWLKNNTPCGADGGSGWDGIYCGSPDGQRHVVKIDFTNFPTIKLIGAKLPAQISNLTFLTDIIITGQGITGPIPSEIGSLANLTTINLENNLLQESIPVSIGGLTKLTNFKINNNKLEGFGNGDKTVVCKLLNDSDPDWWKTQNNLSSNPCNSLLTPTVTATQRQSASTSKYNVVPSRARMIAKTMDTKSASVLGVNSQMKLVAASDFTLPSPTGFFVDWQEPAWSLLWIDKVGSHRYAVPVDYDTKPAVDPISPDLVMTNMKLYRDPNPTNPEVLDCSVKLEITIKNIGLANATSFTVKANDRTYKVTEGLPIGAEKTLRFDHYTHGFSYGPNIVQLDIEDDIYELREDNNIAERYLFLGGFITPSCPLSAFVPDWITPIPSVSPTIDPSISPSVSVSPSPTDISGVPVDMTKVNIQLKVKLQGVRADTFSSQYSHLKMGVKVGRTDTNTSTDFVYGDFVRTSGAIYEGLVTFDPQKVPVSSNYKISVKGPKHIAKRFCISTPTGADSYFCASTAGSINLKPGIQSFDFSSVGLSPGDLPIGGAQDGVVDSSDLAFIRNNLGKKTAEVLKVGDLNLDGIVDTQDFSIVVNSLINNEDEL